jgi:hypothetical protein
MEQSKIDNSLWRPTNPHDRFCRRTVFHPLYASDFLKSFGDSVLSKHIDLDHLQEAPTTHLSDELKEVLLDASLMTRLVDTNFASEVLFILEHKSRPSQTVALQLLAAVGLSLRFRWLLSNRPESGNFVPPVPIMVVVYNGRENWEGEIWFQDFYPDLPEEIRQLVPQFRVIFINLRRFKYGQLPGRPETQAFVESLMRATDETFIEQLPSVLQHVADAGPNEHLRLDMTCTISSYCTWAAHATAEQINRAITTVFKGQEGIHMAEAVQKSIIQEGIEIGRSEGEAIGGLKEKVKDILSLLQFRFVQVPEDISVELNKRTDLTALQSLFSLAYHCQTLDEFANGLK